MLLEISDILFRSQCINSCGIRDKPNGTDLFAETTSDQSDVEGRIRTLTEELKRRKLEAERLKKEQKKKQKEKLRAHEDSLKKQIEVGWLIVAWWRHIATQIWVNIGSSNG